MSTLKILLVGYYGKANFGDDVLLKVAHGRVRQWQPDAEIYILCDQYRDDYLSVLVGENIRLIQPGYQGHFDLIVHGGGGTFFDFGNFGLVDRVINQVVEFAGFDKYTFFEQNIRKLLGVQRLSAEKRLGWGIGVGTYSAGSKKLRHNISTLLDFDALVVRDFKSIDNLYLLGITERIVCGSDLAFLDEYWVPPSVRGLKTAPVSRPRLGLILRDWLTGTCNNYLRIIGEMLPALNRQYELSLFVFDKRIDKDLVALAEPYNTNIWAPPTADFGEFCALLAKQDVVVSSRAHGAICSAVLGVPSVLIELEPKLRTVHNMLPESSLLLSPNDLSLVNLNEAIEAMLCRDDAVVTSNVNYNKTLIDDAVNETLKIYA